MTQIQFAGTENFELLASEFQRRYEPQFALVHAMSMFSAIPALRGFWPGSGNRQGAYYLTDFVNGYNLTNSGTVQWGFTGVAPWVEYATGVSYYAHDIQFRITGAESSTYSSNRGLTIGAWVRFTNNATSDEAVLWKGEGTTSSYCYGLHRLNTGAMRFEIWNSTAYNISSSTTVPGGQWHFVVGRFKPSSTRTIYVTINDTHWSNSSSIPTTIQDVTSYFSLGARGNGAPSTWSLQMTGRISMAFVSAAFLDDYYIETLYSQTRALYGN